MLKRMPRVSKKVLTEQLRDLEKQGLIDRELRVSRYPQEVFYTLTPTGASLRKLIDDIFNWGMANLLDEPSREIAGKIMTEGPGCIGGRYESTHNSMVQNE